MTIKMDLVQGSGGGKNSQGRRRTRGAIVSGLTGSSNAMIEAAFSELETAGYTIGSSHPERASCVLKEVNASAVKGGAVECQLVYEDVFYNSAKKPQPATSYNTVSGRASLRQVQTNKDINDDDIIVEYIYPTQYVSPQGTKPFESLTEAERTHTSSPMVSKLVPEMTITIPQIENANPQAKAKAYIGKVNSGSFVGDSSATAGQWLLVDVQWESSDGGVTYEVSYTFHCVPEGWNSEVVYFIDPNTGVPPANLPSSGIYPLYHYEEVDFSGLGITLI